MLPGVSASAGQIDDALFAGDGNDQAIVIALDVENDVSVLQHAEELIMHFDLDGLFLCGFAGLIEPGLEWLFCGGMAGVADLFGSTFNSRLFVRALRLAWIA